MLKKKNRYPDVSTEPLEVNLPAPTLALLRQEARRRGVPEAQVVREAIEGLLAGERPARVRAAEPLFRVGAPVADLAEMTHGLPRAARPSGAKR